MAQYQRIRFFFFNQQEISISLLRNRTRKTSNETDSSSCEEKRFCATIDFRERREKEFPEVSSDKWSNSWFFNSVDGEALISTERKVNGEANEWSTEDWKRGLSCTREKGFLGNELTGLHSPRKLEESPECWKVEENWKVARDSSFFKTTDGLEETSEHLSKEDGEDGWNDFSSWRILWMWSWRIVCRRKWDPNQDKVGHETSSNRVEVCKWAKHNVQSKVTKSWTVNGKDRIKGPIPSCLRGDNNCRVEVGSISFVEISSMDKSANERKRTFSSAWQSRWLGEFSTHEETWKFHPCEREKNRARHNAHNASISEGSPIAKAGNDWIVQFWRNPMFLPTIHQQYSTEEIFLEKTRYQPW